MDESMINPEHVSEVYKFSRREDLIDAINELLKHNSCFAVNMDDRILRTTKTGAEKLWTAGVTSRD